jgi:transposase
MRKIRDVLRLKLEARLSHERIAASLGISKGVVAKYVSLASVAGLDWATVQTLSDTALERRVVQGRLDRPTHYVLPDYGRAHQELRRKGMTLMLLWEEYVTAHPGQPTYRYSQFCERYRRYALRLKRSMRQIHRAGEKLFVDYAGPTVELADGSRAHVFVAALGASSYTFACATPRETMADWLQGCARALSFIGGVPQLIVPDNPRAMIANPNRYEPRANETVEDFARHYGTSVLPARPRHPQDTAKVESAVQVVERWILMRLRHRRFASVDDVNEAIEPLLQRLNSKLFQKLPGSRASAFADLDAPALQALPLQPWEWAVFKSVRVHIDHHIEIDGHRYSVPQNLVGLLLEARITEHAVELLHRGQRVAAHQRRRPQGWLHDRRRPPAGGAPRSSRMDTRAPRALGAEHRRGHGPPGSTLDRRAAPPRAWLPRVSRAAIPGAPLWQGPAGGGQPDRPRAGNGEVRPREGDPGQCARQGCREHDTELD